MQSVAIHTGKLLMYPAPATIRALNQQHTAGLSCWEKESLINITTKTLIMTTNLPLF